MKKIYILVFTILTILLFPIRILGLTEDEARKVIVDYANFLYNNKKDTIVYISPGGFDFNEALNAKYNNPSKDAFGVDCNAFVSFVVYNAFQANKPSDVFDKFNRVGGNAQDGWSTHSQYYSSQMYKLNLGENIASAAKRYDLESKLKPGDMIAVVGYAKSSYTTYDEAKEGNNKGSHIMLYIGDGKYMHNTNSGNVKIDSLPTISHGLKMGASFDGGTHGSITIFRVQKTENLPSALINNFRYPDGYGNYKYYGSGVDEPSSYSYSSSSEYSSSSSSGGSGFHDKDIDYNEEFKKIVYLASIVITALRVTIPVILLIMAIIDLIKAITSEDEKGDIKKIVTYLVKKVVLAFLVFILPTFVTILTRISGTESEWAEYAECLNNTLECHVSLSGDTIEDEDPPSSSSSEGSSSSELHSSSETSSFSGSSSTTSDSKVKLEKNGIYVQISSSENVSGYYFSNSKQSLNGNEKDWIKSSKKNIDFVLLPGDYYIYTKTSSGKIVENNVKISESDIVDTKKASDISELRVRVDDFLESKGTSLSEFNDMIYRSVTIAGANTREGTAVASLSVAQVLYKRWKVKIPYGCEIRADFGLNPVWGEKTTVQAMIDRGYNYRGIHCGGFVAWSFSNSNFDMNSGIGSSRQLFCWGYGAPKRESSSYFGSIGDAVTVLDYQIVRNSCSEGGKGGHVGVISYVSTNGFWVTEADTVGVVTTYEKASNTRWSTIFDMTNTYERKAKSSKMKTGF